MALELLKNLVEAEVATGFDSAATSIVLKSGHGARMPTSTPYFLTVHNATDYPYASRDPDREIVFVTLRSVDTLTVIRGQGGTTAKAHNTTGKTYVVTQSITAEMFNNAQGLAEYNVKDFGAKGDGVTNDNAAIQAALDAVPTTGATVYFPSGTYLHTAPFSIKSNTRIIGAGWNATILKHTGVSLTTGASKAGVLECVGTDPSPKSNVEIRDLKIQGSHNYTDSTSSADKLKDFGIRLEYLNDVVIENVWLTGLAGEACYAEGSCRRVHFVDSRAINCESNGFNFNGLVVEGIISRNFCQDIGAMGIEVVSYDCIIENNVCKNCQYGVLIGAGAQVSGGQPRRTVRGNHCIGNRVSGIGMVVHGEWEVLIQGNVCESNAQHGILLQGGASTATVSTGYDAAATTVVLSSGQGANFSSYTTPFWVSWWNSTDYKTPLADPNFEVVRVDARTTDTLTITRAQRGTTAKTHNAAGNTYKMRVFHINSFIDVSGNICAHNSVSIAGDGIFIDNLTHAAVHGNWCFDSYGWPPSNVDAPTQDSGISVNGVGTTDESLFVYDNHLFGNVNNQLAEQAGVVFTRWRNFINALPVMIPVSHTLTDANVTLTNMPAAVTEILTSSRYRTKVDLSGANEFRILVNVQTAGSSGSKLGLQYTTDGGVTWNGLDNGTGGAISDANILIDATGTVVSSWAKIAAGARADREIRIVTKDGDGVADPVIAMFKLQLR